MTISVQWNDDQHTIIVFTFSGSWSWADFHQACDVSRKMHQTVPHAVFSIFDMRDGDSLPTNVFSNIRYALDVTDPPNRTHTQAVVGAGFLVKALGEVIVRMHGNRYDFGLEFVSSLDRAREIAYAELGQESPLAGGDS
jgi:hypothetical protein